MYNDPRKSNSERKITSAQSPKYLDEKGAFRTASLFHEKCLTDNLTAPFTLKDFDYISLGVEYKSLKLIYINFEDVTEYEFAIYIFGSYNHLIMVTFINTGNDIGK